MLKLGICGFEFSHHVVLIVVTIVAEYTGIYALGEQVAKPDGDDGVGCKQPLPYFPMREAGTRTIRQGYACHDDGIRLRRQRTGSVSFRE